MIQTTDIEKLERFCAGISDRKEEQYIYSLFAENEGNKAFKEQIAVDFYDYLKNHPDESHNLSYLLDRIHHSMHEKEYKKRHSVAKQIFKWYSVAAAVFLVPILIAGGIWMSNQFQQEMLVAEAPLTSTLFAPMGSRISFSLPDGTQGWLNSGSSLEYNIPFKNNRQIAVSGEAWFDVFHDTDHPFEVKAGGSKVKVLGTKFNLNAYPFEDHIEVVLEEGKVEFHASPNATAIEMKPDERLVFSGGAIHINTTEASKYAAWKEGKLVFKSDPMAEVARRIERWYNVELKLVDKELEDYVIRGTFQDDSLEDVLRYLSMTSPIRYRILDREILPDGTWHKKQILLYRKNLK